MKAKLKILLIILMSVFTTRYNVNNDIDVLDDDNQYKHSIVDIFLGIAGAVLFISIFIVLFKIYC